MLGPFGGRVKGLSKASSRSSNTVCGSQIPVLASRKDVAGTISLSSGVGCVRKSRSTKLALSTQQPTADDNEAKYVDEGIYRLGGIPEFEEQASDGELDVAAPLSSSSDEGERSDAEGSPGPISVRVNPFRLDKAAFAAAILGLQCNYRASDSLLEGLLKVTSDFFGVMDPPSSLYQVYKVLGRITSFVQQLEYICESCGSSIDVGSTTCSRVDCGKKQFKLNCGYAFMDIPGQLRQLVSGKFS